MRQFFQGVAVMAALMPGMAWGCTQLAPFAAESLVMADIVMVGEVTGFEMIHEGPGAALVTVRVSEVMKGEAGGETVMVWNDGQAMGPFEPRARVNVVIGAMAVGREGDALVTDFRPDLPMIVQPYCGDVWMQPATPALVAEVKAMITP
jgi:hypothetical protein